LSQLNKVEKFVKRRNEIAAIYDKEFEDNPLIVIPPKPHYENSRHAYHIYPLLLDKRIDRKDVFIKLRERGILCQVHYIPVHLQPYYRRRFGYKEGDFKNAEEYYKREITIPLYPKMADNEVEYVIKSVKEVVR
jgi:dTDP-4-amino-4,6-dideoxygalactose transaminase